MEKRELNKKTAQSDLDTSISSAYSNTAQALRFEYTVNYLLMHIAKTYGNLNFKFDKNRVMEAERIKTVHTRSDGTGSFPDAEGYQGKKIMVFDAKNHSSTRIGIKEIEKLVGDTEVRRGRAGILVIHERGCLTDDAYESCKECGIIVIQLQKDAIKAIAGISELDERKYNKKYLTVKNVHLLYNAIHATFKENKVPPVLITKEGRINKKCKAWKDFEKGKTTLEEHGVILLEKPDLVDKKCTAYQKYKEYEEVKKKRKELSNYDHKAAKEAFKKATQEKKAAKKQADEENKGESYSKTNDLIIKAIEATKEKEPSNKKGGRKKESPEEVKENVSKSNGKPGKKHAEIV